MAVVVVALAMCVTALAVVLVLRQQRVRAFQRRQREDVTSDARCKADDETNDTDAKLDTDTIIMYKKRRLWRSLSDTIDVKGSCFQVDDVRFSQRLSRSLTRLSNSCPSVNEPVLGLNITLLDDGGCHRSMDDLLDDVQTPSSVLETSAQIKQLQFSDPPSSKNQAVNNEDSHDNSVRFYITDVAPNTSRTLHASEIHSPFTQVTDGSSERKQSWMSDGTDQVDIIPRGSLYSEYSTTESESDSISDQASQQTESWMFDLGGKRLNSSSFSREEGYEGEDIIDSLTGKQMATMLSSRKQIHTTSASTDLDTCSDFLEDSTDSSPGSEMPVPELQSCQPNSSGRLRFFTYSGKSLSDHSSDEEISQAQHDGVSEDGSVPGSVPGYRPRHSSLDEEDLGLTRTTHATSEIGAEVLRDRQEFEQLAETNYEERYRKTVTREDSGRIPNMIAGMQSKYKAKRNKKEDKSTNQHHFLAISVSNPTTCEVCHKDIANKAALRCDNCLVCVHKNSCPDQLSECDKGRRKEHPQYVSRHDSYRSLQTPEDIPPEYWRTSSRRPLKYSQTMKEIRSSSVLVKSQLEQEFGASLPHKNSLPLLGMTDISESFESLDGVVPSEMSWLYDEPDLLLDVEVSDIWSSTVDEKKKLTKKDCKRQDTIWELINTEKHCVKRLKIMQKIFAYMMLHDLNYTADQVDRLFPRLNDLVDLHVKFLRQLLSRQAKNEDKSVDEIGDILLDQFQGIAGDNMKSVYGVFCSKHKEAMQLYKYFVKNDKKFQNFARYCNNLSVCEKREISDFILGVTFRLSKYPILIEGILKNTKDKKDRENLSQALLSCKDVVQHVDEKIAAYEKLINIQSKMDSKTVNFKGIKFKREDLTAGRRQLLFAGNIGWKSARGRVYNVLVLVLTDLVVFLQKNEQKYTFFIQDNKACVVPLHNLLVREKNDVRGSLGIYIIVQNHSAPEMYELICQNKVEREKWMRTLQDAIRVCPPDADIGGWPVTNPGVHLSNETKRQKQSEHASKVRLVIEQLHQKDEIIKECCDEKNKLMLELLELSTPYNEAGSPRNSQEIDNVNDSVEVVHAAMQEASRLTDILQGTGAQLSRCTSSAGEHQSSTYTTISVPKRAETFSGFDSNYESSKARELTKRSAGDRQEGEERSPPNLYLKQQNRYQNVSDTPNSMLTSQHEMDLHPRKKQIISDMSSDKGWLDELAPSSVTPTLPSQEQMTSIYQIVQYLNIIMNLTSKQCTKVESLRAELEEAKKEIAKLSTDVHNRHTFYHHDQFEELRNLQENVSQEKQKWERAKLHDHFRLESDRSSLADEWREIEKEKLTLIINKENLKKRQQILQHQVNMLREQGFTVTSSSDETFRDDDQEKKDFNNITHQQRPKTQYRSASTDFYDAMAINDNEDVRSLYPYSSETTSGSSHQLNLSNGSLQEKGSVHSIKPTNFSLQSVDTHMEQRLGDVNYQSLPQRNEPYSSNTIPFQHLHTPATVALTSDMPHLFPDRAISSGHSRTHSMSATSHTALKQQIDSISAPSDLSKAMTFSEPKGDLSFSALSGNTTKPSPTSKKPPLTILQSSDAPGGPRTKEVKKRFQRMVNF